jgi:hypothetical protein
MSDSIRESIVKNLVTTLEKIVEGATYGITICRVERIPSSPFSEADFPLAMVQDIAEEKDDGSPVGYSTSVLKVQIIVWDSNYDELSERANLLLADVEKALHSDVTRGGYAFDTNIIGNQLISAEEALPVGGVIIDIEVLYRHTLGDPYSQ